MRIPVNEIFVTIQGEATFTGTPSTFVRLQGCDVGCPWCDTKHTWQVATWRAVPFDAMKAKEADTADYADALPARIAAACMPGPGHVVITGGEPCMHDLTELTAMLIAEGKTVQIETSGTEPIRKHPAAWVTLSPKLAMPGGKKVLESSLELANEIKMPVGKQADIDALRMLLDRVPGVPRALIWLQPLSTSEKATALCVEACIANGWRLSLQTHKFMGVR